MLAPLTEILSVELPWRDSLHEYLDLIIPLIRPWSEDLREERFFVSEQGEKPWLEISADDYIKEAVLHYFNQEGEYVKVVEGNVSTGRWRYFGGSNKLVIDYGGNSIMYELKYLDDHFFILRKYGYGPNTPYLFLGHEPIVRLLEWRDCVELLFDTYRRRARNVRLMLGAGLVLIVLILLFSIV